MRKPQTLTLELIKSRCNIDPITGCWIWGMHTNKDGYAKASEGGMPVFVHRRAFELKNGPLPKGQFALHDCPVRDNPACCNPDHLWAGTRGDNNRDSVKKGRQKVVNRKLSYFQVLAIMKDDRPQQEIAREYSVSQDTISRVKRAACYAWVS